MIEDEPQYEVVLKMVLWDEDRDAIFRRLEVNQVTGKRGEAIYRAARSERVRILRMEGLRSLGIGVVAFLVSIASYFGFKLNDLEVSRFGDGVNSLPLIPWLLGFFSALLFAFGLWKLVQGMIEFLFAPMKKGSVADR